MTQLSREFGEGLYSLCREENIVPDVLEQLGVLSQCLRSQPDFARLLGNMSLPKAERLDILDHALRGQVHPFLLNYMKLLCERGILGEFDDSIKTYRALYYQDAGIIEAVATTGVKLNEEQRESLMKKLRAMTGHQVVLKEKVDPAVMGGVMLEMNGKRYDNTVKHRLESIRQAMDQANV